MSANKHILLKPKSDRDLSRVKDTLASEGFEVDIIQLTEDQHALFNSQTDLLEKLTEDQIIVEAVNDLLEVEQMKFKVLLDSISTGIILLDTMGQIRDINKSALERFFPHYKSAKDLIGKSISEIEISKSLYLQRVLKTVLRGKNFSRKEIKIAEVYRDQGIITVAGFPLIGTLGEVTAALIVLEDAGLREDINKELARFHALETTGILAGTLALDFDNLLNTLKQNVLRLRELIEPDDPISEMVSTIELTSKNASELSQRLSIFTKQSNVETALIEVNQVIREVAAIVSRAFEKRITLSLELAPTLKGILADAIEIRRAILNVLYNACEALPQGGTILIRTGYITPKIARDIGLKSGEEGATWISIQDNGIGMSLEAREKAFMPFFSTKDTTKHSGMGLTIVNQIVKRGGGTIQVESNPGRGSTVSLYFPAVTQKSLDAKNKRLGSRGRKGTILLVDDEQLVLAMARKLIETDSYRVITASSASDANDLYHEHRHEIDLIILDMFMPGMDGCEVMQQILSVNSDAKILLSSGRITESGAEEAIAKGAVGFIQKPYRMNNLLQKIGEVLCEEKSEA